MKQKMEKKNKLPKIEYRKVLYATDLSETGRAAFPHAASIAHHYGAKLTVFHVLESSHLEKYLMGYMSEHLWNEIKTRNLEEARDLLINRKRDDAEIANSVEQFCDDTMAQMKKQPYVSYDVIVKEGDPVEQIVKEATEGKYDLVVLSKQGQRGISDALMGSTTWRVLHQCPTPVLVVRV